MFVTFHSAKEAVDDPVGELSIQVDYMSHPGTGDHKLTVKGSYCYKKYLVKLFHQNNNFCFQSLVLYYMYTVCFSFGFFSILVVEAKDLRWHAAGMIISFQTGVSQIILFQSHHPTVTSNTTLIKSVSEYICDYLHIISS